MIKDDEARPATADGGEGELDTSRPAWSWAAFCCLLAFLACLALMIAPAYRLIGSTLMASLPTTRLLVSLGSWLPEHLPWLSNAKGSSTSTNTFEFLFFIVLAFLFYCAALLLLLRLPAEANYARIQACMWVCVALAGGVLILSPFLLSHDLFVYADYGHTILTTHANLYFTPPAAVSHNRIDYLDDWNYAISAYGPLWIGFSTLVALFGGDHPLRYILGFRALGLLAHLVNTWLVLGILRDSGRPPRTVMLGALLYALNPLMLIESALGAHNDTEMITFLLLGILLCLRAERCGFARFIDYAPPAVAFTLAILIKYSCLPVLLLYLALLARASWQAGASSFPSFPSSPSPRPRFSGRRWPAALLKTGSAALLSAGIVLLAYAPFWIGHSVAAILNSFSAPPSLRFAENSLLRASQDRIHLRGLPAAGSWMRPVLQLLANHSAWNIASIIAVLGGMSYGIILLRRRPPPYTHTLVVASLLTFGALLLVTPWLYAWYVTWLVALAAILPGRPARGLCDALVAFALAFSISIFLTYTDTSLSGSGAVTFTQCLFIFGIPLLIFSLAFLKRWVAPDPGIQQACAASFQVFPTSRFRGRH